MAWLQRGRAFHQPFDGTRDSAPGGAVLLDISRRLILAAHADIAVAGRSEAFEASQHGGHMRIAVPCLLDNRRTMRIQFAISDQRQRVDRSEEHTSELQSLMRISYAVFCLKNKNNNNNTQKHSIQHVR